MRKTIEDLLIKMENARIARMDKAFLLEDEEEE